MGNTKITSDVVIGENLKVGSEVVYSGCMGTYIIVSITSNMAIIRLKGSTYRERKKLSSLKQNLKLFRVTYDSSCESGYVSCYKYYENYKEALKDNRSDSVYSVKEE